MGRFGGCFRAAVRGFARSAGGLACPGARWFGGVFSMVSGLGPGPVYGSLGSWCLRPIWRRRPCCVFWCATSAVIMVLSWYARRLRWTLCLPLVRHLRSRRSALTPLKMDSASSRSPYISANQGSDSGMGRRASVRRVWGVVLRSRVELLWVMVVVAPLNASSVGADTGFGMGSGLWPLSGSARVSPLPSSAGRLWLGRLWLGRLWLGRFGLVFDELVVVVDRPGALDRVLVRLFPVDSFGLDSFEGEEPGFAVAVGVDDAGVPLMATTL